jgi:hypothetical protein
MACQDTGTFVRNMDDPEKLLLRLGRVLRLQVK